MKKHMSETCFVQIFYTGYFYNDNGAYRVCLASRLIVTHTPGMKNGLFWKKTEHQKHFIYAICHVDRILPNTLSNLDW